MSPPGGGLTRRQKEQRIYAYSKVAVGAGVSTVVLVVLAIVGVLGAGPAVLAAIVALGAVLLARRTVSG